MVRPDANTIYLKENGKVSFHLEFPKKEHSICKLSIEVKTSIDPFGKCAVKMDMDFVEHYWSGKFDGPHYFECDFGVKGLKVLSAFPGVLEVLINTEDELLKISSVISELEAYGFKKGPYVDATYKQLEKMYLKQTNRSVG